MRRNFLATLLLSDDYRQLERSSRRFQVLDIGPRLQYRMGDDVTLGFTYDREQLDSNSLTRYSDDTGMITVKKTVLTRPELDREP